MLVQAGLSPWEEGSAYLTKDVIQWLSLLSLCSTSSFELRCRGFQAVISQGVGMEWGEGEYRWSPLHWHVPVDSPLKSLLWEWVKCLAEGWGAPPRHGCFSGNGPRCHLPYHLHESGNLESGLLLQGDLIALWHSPGTFKLFKRLMLPSLCCDAGGNIDWPWKMNDCWECSCF